MLVTTVLVDAYIITVFHCIIRQNFKKNSNNYRQRHRYQGGNYCNWNDRSQNAVQWRWVHEPHAPPRWISNYNESRNVNRPRQHSGERYPTNRSTSDSASTCTTVENTPPSDSLTNKLTERTSVIINNVLGGKDSADTEKCAKASTTHMERLSTPHTVDASRATASSQLNRPNRVSTNKSSGSEKVSETSKQKGSTVTGHVSMRTILLFNYKMLSSSTVLLGTLKYLTGLFYDLTSVCSILLRAFKVITAQKL